MKAPCELSVWYILPLIRGEVARRLVEGHGMTQAKAARRLSITDAAVSQYISGKRGRRDLRLADYDGMLDTSAARIAKTKSEATVQREICILCKRMSRDKCFGCK